MQVPPKLIIWRETSPSILSGDNHTGLLVVYRRKMLFWPRKNVLSKTLAIFFIVSNVSNLFRVEKDAQLLANRIALLKQEEMRTWKKIEETKKRA